MTTLTSNLLQKSRHLTQKIHPTPPKLLIRSHIRQNSSNSSDYFPWKHSPLLPERISTGDDLSGMPNNFRARFIRRMLAGRELNLNFWDVLPLGFVRGWEEELAGNFSTAYGMALAELLQSVFKVPVHNDFVTISIDSSVQNTETKSDTDETKSDTDENDTDHNSETNTLVENEYLNNMLEKNLLARYQLIDKDSIHLKLSVTPTSSQLQNIFLIPLLTREIVEQKPHLKGGYLRIEKEFEETKSYNRVRELTYALSDEVGRNSSKRTVVAEAAIWCNEFFQVRDAKSGEVLRGMQDGEGAEEVVHVVRFEVVTDKREGGGREVGNWRIIDWDDLLDGNRFH